MDKPALLRRLFELACRYSGQILSYTKMLGLISICTAGGMGFTAILER